MTKTIEDPRGTKLTDRYIGRVVGKEKGPTLIFFGGLHGNEPAGVTALDHIFKKLKEGVFKIRGAVYGIRGNVPALLKGKRFLQQDLNRLWTKEGISEIETKKDSDRGAEEEQLIEIKELILELLSSHASPFYFIDLHTTSSKTLPFITINDALINRKFSKQFPVPIILGIEEYLEGPLLSRMNEMGYVSLGFESGQHNEPLAVKNNISFLWLAMVFAGVLTKTEVEDFQKHHRQLCASSEGGTRFYEVIHRQALLNKDSFDMISGFKSFQKVAKGTLLAIQNSKEIKADKNAILFMPLYQEQGAEGFFLIKQTPRWALNMSTALRKIRLDSALTILPGISWSDDKKENLLVNLSIARFFTKSFFHLLGYRNRTVDKTHLIMQNRERKSKNEMYRKEHWY